MIFYCPQVRWTIQLPAGFTVENQTPELFSCRHDKYNHLSAAIGKIGPREDCNESFSRLFSAIPGATIERASSAISVGGKVFELHSFLVIKNGRPVFCYECMFHAIGEYELSISMTYDNEIQRVKMCRCLDESHFG